VALILPASQVLRKNITLPLATEENLRQVIEFQLEQLTPFPPDQVHFGYRLVGRDVERGQLTVEFAATSRSIVDPALTVLSTTGALVKAVLAEDMTTKGRWNNLLADSASTNNLPWFKGLNAWLSAAFLLLLIAVMVAPLLVKREAVVQLLPWVQKGKVAAEAADGLRGQLEARVEQHNFLLEKKRAAAPMVIALEELTRVLPDDTWVLQLDVKGKEMVILGESSSAVKLIGLFEQSPILREASFRAPLTKGQSPGIERYQLAVQIQPETPKADVAVVAAPSTTAASAPPSGGKP
jgi:general secretion pathway protein L